MVKMVRKSIKNNNKLTADQVYDLLTGLSFEGFPSEEARRRAWERNRAFLIDKDIRDNKIIKREPGTRPLAFWKYEAPEPRRIIENGQYWKPAPGYEESWRGYFGMYACMLPAVKNLKIGQYSKHYESEYEYLKRLNLLLPGEKEEALNCK